MLGAASAAQLTGASVTNPAPTTLALTTVSQIDSTNWPGTAS